MQTTQQDLFYTTILAALMGSTRPCASLARAKPPGRVLSPPLTVPLVMQLAVVIVFQVCLLKCVLHIGANVCYTLGWGGCCCVARCWAGCRRGARAHLC